MWTRRFRPARAAAALALGVLLLAGPARADDTAVSPAPSGAVSILDAQRDGQLNVSLRGQGQTQVRVALTNRSPHRLQVVLPPGLVAAASTGQGFQSMGLGLPTDQPGRFGGIAATETQGNGFRSIAVEAATPALAVAPGQTVEFSLPAVCLNFGIPTPTPRDQFVLVDVTEFTSDARAIKALRSLATLGTSQGVAQAVVWNVFNQMEFNQLAKQANKYLNPAEISVAARFVSALDASPDQTLVDPEYFRQGRILVRVNGDRSLQAEAARLHDEMSAKSLLGLPVQSVGAIAEDHSLPASLLLDVNLTPGDRDAQTRARVLVRYNSALGGWTRMDTVSLTLDGAPGTIQADRLARALDEALARAFVSSTPASRQPGLTNFRIVNRLPMTVRSVVLRTGNSEGDPVTTVDRIEIGPGRAAITQVPAPIAIVEKVELSGL